MPDRYGFQTIATELDGRILRVIPSAEADPVEIMASLVRFS